LSARLKTADVSVDPVQENAPKMPKHVAALVNATKQIRLRSDLISMSRLLNRRSSASFPATKPASEAGGTLSSGGADRVPVLDGLRGIAILLVMMLHFTYYGGPRPEGPLDEFVYQAALSGWIGVDLFFGLFAVSNG
jgi:hypothetical protein